MEAAVVSDNSRVKRTVEISHECQNVSRTESHHVRAAKILSIIPGVTVIKSKRVCQSSNRETVEIPANRDAGGSYECIGIISDPDVQRSVRNNEDHGFCRKAV